MFTQKNYSINNYKDRFFLITSSSQENFFDFAEFKTFLRSSTVLVRPIHRSGAVLLFRNGLCVALMLDCARSKHCRVE
jgi:hypothetical protein